MNMKSILAACFAVASGLTAVAEQPKNVAELFGGPEAIAVIRSAERVEACVLQRAGSPGSEKWKETSYLLLTKAGADKLRALLLDESTYSWEVADGNSSSHNIVMVFTHGSKTAKMAFALDCDFIFTAHDGTWFTKSEAYPKRRDEFYSVFASELSQHPAFAEVRKEHDARETERTRRQQLYKEAAARDEESRRNASK